MVMAGGAGERLSILCGARAKPAVPFGGKYRIIDFTLSNCANSGIDRIGIVTQYYPQSLAAHIGVGKPWDLDRASGGITLLHPYVSRKQAEWYKGTADAIYQNLYYVEDQRCDEVIILAGDHIYTMDYSKMIDFHRSKEAQVTVGIVQVAPQDASRFGMVNQDKEGRIVEFYEKIAEPRGTSGSMGIYVFNKDRLVSCLEENQQRNQGFDFGRDILPRLIKETRVYGYTFEDYWRDVGTVEAYWQANMDLIVDLPDFNLYRPNMRVSTVSHGYPPAKIGPLAHVSRSIISEGAIIVGQVVNSIISPGVFVEGGSVVRDSILFSDTIIDSGGVVDRCIIDKEARIREGCHLGWGRDYRPNEDEPTHLNTGITLVGKGAQIPPGTRIGRNCKINPWVGPSDFPGDLVASGGTVGAKDTGRYRV